MNDNRGFFAQSVSSIYNTMYTWSIYLCVLWKPSSVLQTIGANSAGFAPHALHDKYVVTHSVGQRCLFVTLLILSCFLFVLNNVISISQYYCCALDLPSFHLCMYVMHVFVPVASLVQWKIDIFLLVQNSTIS